MTTPTIRATADDMRLVSYDRLQALLFDAPLACARDRITQVVGNIGPRLLGLAGKGDVELTAELFGACLPDPDDVEITPEGVAIVPIRGTFAPRAGVYEAMSGMVSYEATAKTLAAIAAKPEVRGLVLALDSPGGTVAGVSDAAAAIAAIPKPVYAVAAYQATSAAYWLACEAARIFVPADATVGSIGVIAVRFDATKWDKEQGFAYTFVTTGARKADGQPHKPTSKDELDALQARIDQAGEMFFAAVAKARRMTIEAVRDLEAALVMGQAAVDVGLADQVGNVADAVAALTKKLTAQQSRSLGFGATTTKEVTMAEGTEGEGGAAAAPAEAVASGQASDKVISLAEHQKLRDEAVADAAKKASADAEVRASKIVGLCAIARRPELAAQFIKDGLTEAQAGERLQALAAEADAQLGGIRSHVDTGAGSVPAGTKLDVNGLMHQQRAQAVAHRAGGGR